MNFYEAGSQATTPTTAQATVQATAYATTQATTQATNRCRDAGHNRQGCDLKASPVSKGLRLAPQDKRETAIYQFE